MIIKMTNQRLPTCSTRFHLSKLLDAKSLERLKETVTTRMKLLAVRQKIALSCAKYKPKSQIVSLALQTENKSSQAKTRMLNSQLSICLPSKQKRQKYPSIEFKR